MTSNLCSDNVSRELWDLVLQFTICPTCGILSQGHEGWVTRDTLSLLGTCLSFTSRIGLSIPAACIFITLWSVARSAADKEKANISSQPERLSSMIASSWHFTVGGCSWSPQGTDLTAKISSAVSALMCAIVRLNLVFPSGRRLAWLAATTIATASSFSKPSGAYDVDGYGITLTSVVSQMLAAVTRPIK